MSPNKYTGSYRVFHRNFSETYALFCNFVSFIQLALQRMCILFDDVHCTQITAQCAHIVVIDTMYAFIEE